RNADMRPNARQHGFDLTNVQRTGPRDAFEGHVIDIATGHTRYLRHALVCGGGREQEDQVHAVRAQVSGKVFTFFGRVVNNEHPVHTSSAGVPYECLCAVPLVVPFNRVGVPHEHHGGGGVALAEGLDHGQHLGE